MRAVQSLEVLRCAAVRRRKLEDARLACRERRADRGVARSGACPARRRPRSLVCPPFVYLWETGRLLKDQRASRSARSRCARRRMGAFTGEVSAGMLQGRRLPLRDRRAFGASRLVQGRRCAGGAQVPRGAGAGADPDPVRRRNARRARARRRRRRSFRGSSTAVLDLAGVQAFARRGRSRTSRCGRSAPARTPRRSRRRKCTRISGPRLRPGMLRLPPDVRDPVRRQRQGVQCPGAVRDAGCRRRPGRRRVAQGG